MNEQFFFIFILAPHRFKVWSCVSHAVPWNAPDFLLNCPRWECEIAVVFCPVMDCHFIKSVFLRSWDRSRIHWIHLLRILATLTPGYDDGFFFFFGAKTDSLPKLLINIYTEFGDFPSDNPPPSFFTSLCKLRERQDTLPLEEARARFSVCCHLSSAAKRDQQSSAHKSIFF